MVCKTVGPKRVIEIRRRGSDEIHIVGFGFMKTGIFPFERDAVVFERNGRETV